MPSSRIVALVFVLVAVVSKSCLVAAFSDEMQRHMTNYVDKKVKELSKYKKYVCTAVGRKPEAFECWDDRGNQKRAGGACQSPKGCLIYETPGFNMNNKVQSWTGDKSYNKLKNGLFKTWGLSKSALENVELASFGESGKFVNFFVYTETNKGTGAFSFELASLHTHSNGNLNNIGYINIQSKGWLVKPRNCVSTKTKKGGLFGGSKTKRSCSERGLHNHEIDNVRKALELYAFKSVEPMIGGSKVKAPPCKREFNCYCYMERNKGKVPSGGREECKHAYEHFLDKGKRAGLKGTCCGKGAQVSRPGAGAEVLFDGAMCERDANWKYDQRKKEITVWGGCKATFQCDGDVVKCEQDVGRCPEEPDDDRRRLNGRRLYWEYQRCREECGVPDDDDDRRRLRRILYPHRLHHHTMCKNKCGISYDDDDGWDDINENDQKCISSCVLCFEKCVGCAETCKCSDVKLRRRLSKTRLAYLDGDGYEQTMKPQHFTFSHQRIRNDRDRVKVLKNQEDNLWLTSLDDAVYESRGRDIRIE